MARYLSVFIHTNFIYSQSIFRQNYEKNILVTILLQCNITEQLY